MSNAYKLSISGVLTTYPIPERGATIRALHRRPDADRRILPGIEHADWVSDSLPVCVDLAKTIAPGVEFWFGPRMEGLRSETGDAMHGGSHFMAGHHRAPWPVCIVRTNLATSDAANLTIHEAAHSVQSLLSADEFRAIDDALLRGPKISCSYDGAWRERYARLVADAGMMLLMTGRFISHPSAPETMVIARILLGEVGRRRPRLPVQSSSKRAKRTSPATWICRDGFPNWLGCPTRTS